MKTIKYIKMILSRYALYNDTLDRFEYAMTLRSALKCIKSDNSYILFARW